MLRTFKLWENLPTVDVGKADMIFVSKMSFDVTFIHEVYILLLLIQNIFCIL